MATAKKTASNVEAVPAIHKEELVVTVETPNKPNKDGFIGGQPVSQEDYAKFVAKQRINK